MFLDGLGGWFLLIVKWEAAVLKWESEGQSESFVLITALAGACFELGIMLGLLEMALHRIRRMGFELRMPQVLQRGLERMRLNGIENHELPAAGTSAIAWLVDRKLGVTGRYALIFGLAVAPIIPFLTS